MLLSSLKKGKMKISEPSIEIKNFYKYAIVQDLQLKKKGQVVNILDFSRPHAVSYSLH